MKTPPDFPAANVSSHNSDEEFRRVYSKLDGINDIVVGIRNDRKWVFMLLGVAGVLVSLMAAQMGDWSSRLGGVERAVDSHITQSIEVHNGMRRDLTRNAIEIEKIHEQNQWRPRAVEKKEK